VAALALLAAPAAQAAELAGVRMPDHVTVAGKRLVLNGLGLREATFLKVDVYVAGLYLPAKTSKAKKIIRSRGPKRVVQRFLRDVDREDIVRSTRKGVRKNYDGDFAKLKGRLDRFVGWLPSLREGNTVTLTHLPGKGVLLQIDGKRKGTIRGDDFARALWSGWLGPHPPNPGLKRGMLGR